MVLSTIVVSTANQLSDGRALAAVGCSVRGGLLVLPVVKRVPVDPRYVVLGDGTGIDPEETVL